MALTAGTSCVDGQEYLVVERAVWWTGDTSDCTLTGSETVPLSMPVDTFFDSPVGMAFVLTNYRSVNENSNTGVNDTELVLDYAEVNLAFSGGGLPVSSFEYQLPTTSLYGGDTSIVKIDLPAEVVDSLRTTMGALPAGTIERLNMDVIVHARTSGSPGSNAKLGAFETRPFIYPLDICYGCLAGCFPASECGGEGDTLTCPDSVNWYGVCGYAQGISVIHPTCSTG